MLAKGGWDKFTVLYAKHCVILNLSSDVVLWLDLEAELWMKQTGLTVDIWFWSLCMTSSVEIVCATLNS